MNNGRDERLKTQFVTCITQSYAYAHRLLLQFGAFPNVLGGQFNIAPLHIAAMRGLIKTTESLLTAGADVNIFSTTYGTPFHVAASRNHS
jgi:ankyrin repeat protein